MDKTGIHVACGEDVLVLREVQLEGKKRMETDAFLRGYQVTEGTMLTDHKEDMVMDMDTTDLTGRIFF